MASISNRNSLLNYGLFIMLRYHMNTTYHNICPKTSKLLLFSPTLCSPAALFLSVQFLKAFLWRESLPNVTAGGNPQQHEQQSEFGLYKHQVPQPAPRRC